MKKESFLVLLCATSILYADADQTSVFHTSLQRKPQQQDLCSSSDGSSCGYPHSNWNCQNRAHPAFFDVRQNESKGIGYHEGYTSSDLFLSYTTERHFTPFLDLRGHHFNSNKWAANGGLGFRDLSESLNLVFGINAFYDYRQVKRAYFQQLGLGIEILGEQWDFRANGYIPLAQRRKTYSQQIVTEDGNTFFKRRIEYDFIGGDLEIGRVILKWAGLHAKVTGGAYYLNGFYNKNVIGGFLRLSGHLSPYIGFNVQGSYDPTFTWIGQGELSLILPFGRRLPALKFGECRKKRYTPQERFLEPVSRFEIIPVNHHTQRTEI
ncbi:MAG: inverse autotransporter beta domain-containing protein [Chlamydiales bacterium]